MQRWETEKVMGLFFSAGDPYPENKRDSDFGFASRFHLTTSWPSIFFPELANNRAYV
jgi:hypothetical protein